MKSAVSVIVHRVRILVLAVVVGLGAAAGAYPQAGVSVGDIVQTNLNGQTVVGEIVRVNGPAADVNFGQNNVGKFLNIQDLRVLQRAGTGAKATCAIGEVVQVPYLANTVITGKLMKTNGAYCEVDSSGSGFTGWNKCADMRHGSPASSCGPAAAGARGGASGPAAGSASGKPPKPGLTSCAGKFEGRYAASSGLGNFTIVFRAGKATLKGPLADDEELECWTGGGKILLHKEGEPEDLPLDINDDGTIDTPFGEIKKKSN